MSSTKLLIISLIIVLNIFNSLCDIKESEVNKNVSNTSIASDLNIEKPMDKTLKQNGTDSSMPSIMSRINFNNGFILRALSVVTVISLFVTLVCILRVFCSKRRWNRLKVSKDKSNPKYDSLPTVAINNSLKKNAFALIDSEDEELTIFDASHRLIN